MLWEPKKVEGIFYTEGEETWQLNATSDSELDPFAIVRITAKNLLESEFRW